MKKVDGVGMNIQEVAKLAKVSVSTVSKIINGKDNDISEPTRKRVLKIVEEQNYIPYAKYRMKEGMANRLVGLVIPGNNSYYGVLIAMIEEALQERGYRLVVYTVSEMDAKVLDEALEQLWKRGVIGVLVNGTLAASHVPENCKAVYFTETEEFDQRQQNTFYFRKYEAGRLAAEALLEAGHRKIGCILEQSEQNILNGIEAVFRERQLPEGDLVSYLGKDREDLWKNGTGFCMTDNVSAMICGSSEITGMVLEYAGKTGIQAPQELSIVCMEEQDILEYMAGGIASVKYPLQQMTASAVHHLLQMITEKKECEIARKFFPVLQKRGSIRKNEEGQRGGKIVVVGSMNIDNVIEGVRIPVNGETHIADNILVMPGGKGGNQAVGVGKLGGRAYMIGRIGKDADGKLLFKGLSDCGVYMDGVEFDDQLSSGQAFVHLDREGENTIVVYRGANGNLDGAQLERHGEVFQNAKYCLISSEISMETIRAAKKHCRKNQTEMILKPSALEEIEEDILEGIDYLVPNEKEMEQICPGNMPLEEKADRLLANGVKNVIVTLGKQGSYLKNKAHSIYFPSAPFTAIDSTGGADSFISAMAFSLSEGNELIYSIIYATYAAGITVTRYGVQEAMPDKKTIGIYIEEMERKYREIKEII